MTTAAAFTELNWQDASTYDYAHTLPRRAWAWEFLRRNALFHKDWTLNCRKVAMEAISPHLNVVTLPTENGPLRPWGLHFQQFPTRKCHNGGCLLGPECMPPCAAVVLCACAIASRVQSVSAIPYAVPDSGAADACRNPPRAVLRSWSIPSASCLGVQHLSTGASLCGCTCRSRQFRAPDSGAQVSQ